MAFNIVFAQQTNDTKTFNAWFNALHTKKKKKKKKNEHFNSSMLGAIPHRYTKLKRMVFNIVFGRQTNDTKTFNAGFNALHTKREKKNGHFNSSMVGSIPLTLHLW